MEDAVTPYGEGVVAYSDCEASVSTSRCDGEGARNDGVDDGGGFFAFVEGAYVVEEGAKVL